MTEPEFNSYIESLLGGNLVDVELTTDDYAAAFNRTKWTFLQKGNNNFNQKFQMLNVLVGQTSYTVDKEINTVVRVIKPRAGIYSNDPFSIATFNDIFWNFDHNEGNLLNYELGLQLIERIQRYVAYDADFIFQKARGNQINGTIEFLKPPKKAETWFLECYANLTDAEYYDVVWIQNWMLAECKELLGHAYSKFQSLQGPSGNTSLNGQDLLQEAQREKEALLEDIKNFQDGDGMGMPIMMG